MKHSLFQKINAFEKIKFKNESIEQYYFAFKNSQTSKIGCFRQPFCLKNVEFKKSILKRPFNRCTSNKSQLNNKRSIHQMFVYSTKKSY